jgi:hypothetical protein
MQDHKGMQAPLGLKGFRDFRESRGLRGNRGIRGLKARQVLKGSRGLRGNRGNRGVRGPKARQVLRENRDLLALPVLHAAKANVRLQSKGIIKQTAKTTEPNKTLLLRAEALPEEMLPKLTRIYRLLSVKGELPMAILHKQRVYCPLSDRRV